MCQFKKYILLGIIYRTADLAYTPPATEHEISYCSNANDQDILLNHIVSLKIRVAVMVQIYLCGWFIEKESLIKLVVQGLPTIHVLLGYEFQ